MLQIEEQINLCVYTLKTPSKMDVAPWDKHWIKIEFDGIGWYWMVLEGLRWPSMIFVCYWFVTHVLLFYYFLFTRLLLVCYLFVTRLLLVCCSFFTHLLLVCYSFFHSFVACLLMVCYSFVTSLLRICYSLFNSI